MASVSHDQIAALFANAGVRVVASTYARLPQIYPLFCEVVDPSAASHAPYGDKSTTVIWGADVRRRKDGEEFQSSTMGQGYTPQGAIDLLSGRLDITERDMEANSADTTIANKITDWARQWVENTQNFCEQDIAGLLMRGAITAGDPAYFDGSFVGNDDPNAGKIFDGKSLFATDHPLKFVPGPGVANFVASATLDQTTLTAARVAYSTTMAKDDTNKQFAQTAQFFLSGSTLAPTAEALLESQLASGAMDKNVNYNKLRIIENPFITDTDAWFIGAPGRSIRVMDSGVPQPRLDWDFKSRTWVATIEKRWGRYVRDWRGIRGHNLPTS